MENYIPPKAPDLKDLPPEEAARAWLDWWEDTCVNIHDHFWQNVNVSAWQKIIEELNDKK